MEVSGLGINCLISICLEIFQSAKKILELDKWNNVYMSGPQKVLTFLKLMPPWFSILISINRLTP